MLGNSVMVRARCRSHLEKLVKRFEILKSPAIEETPQSDYRFRIRIDRKRYKQLVSALAEQQNWTNFKEAVELTAGQTVEDELYIEALHKIWQVMFDVQCDSLCGTQSKGLPAATIARIREWL